jgi:hypothetical protein
MYLQSELHKFYLFRDALIEAERALSGDRNIQVAQKEIPTTNKTPEIPAMEITATINMVPSTSQR